MRELDRQAAGLREERARAQRLRQDLDAREVKLREAEVAFSRKQAEAEADLEQKKEKHGRRVRKEQHELEMKRRAVLQVGRAEGRGGRAVRRPTDRRRTHAAPQLPTKKERDEVQHWQAELAREREAGRRREQTAKLNEQRLRRQVADLHGKVDELREEVRRLEALRLDRWDDAQAPPEAPAAGAAAAQRPFGLSTHLAESLRSSGGFEHFPDDTLAGTSSDDEPEAAAGGGEENDENREPLRAAGLSPNFFRENFGGGAEPALDFAAEAAAAAELHDSPALRSHAAAPGPGKAAGGYSQRYADLRRSSPPSAASPRADPAHKRPAFDGGAYAASPAAKAEAKAEERREAGGAARPREVRHSDGRQETVYADGRKEVRYTNGTVKETLPSGATFITFANGDVKKSYPEGKIEYFYAEVQTWHTTHAFGLEVYHFPSGQTEAHFPDGSKEILFADGVARKVPAPDAGAREADVDVSLLSEHIRAPKPRVGAL